MIFQSFILDYLVSLCMKIIHSAVLVGLYYGFITTFSIGPSYLFLLRAQVMEEGTEKKGSARTGFIIGQFIIFISIYYAPLHLALGRPHTITVLAVLYLLFQFFLKNQKSFLNSGSTNKNSIRNFTIQSVFLNNIIFQLFNHFILPSSMLPRLVNIYMFRCNNKMLFVTSSFFGWLIGHFLFMKWLGLVLFWIRDINWIRSNKYIRSPKYLILYSMAQVFSILLFITCVYYLGRIPSPFLRKKLKETQKVEERVEKERALKKKTIDTFSWKENKDPTNSDEEITGNTYKTKHILEESYLSDLKKSYQFQNLYKKTEKEKKSHFFFEKVFVRFFFDSKQWNRPVRYIENNKFDNAVINEMSQYFFAISKSDGKERISFTYIPLLQFFFEKLKVKDRLREFKFEKSPYTEYNNSFFFFNNQKVKNLHIAFLSRIKTLEKKSTNLTLLDIKSNLCNENSTKKYFSKKHDPLLNGSYRKVKSFSASMHQKVNRNTSNLTQIFGINKIHGILFKDTYFQDFEDKKVLYNSIFDSLIFIKKKFSTDTSSIHIKRTGRFFVFSTEKTNLNNFVKTTNDNTDNITNEEGPKIEKKVPRRLYKLISELEQQSGEHREKVSLFDYEIRSRKAKRVVIFNTKKEDTDSNTIDTNTSDETNEVAFMRYSQQPDFRRGIIKGSIRAQRRKIVIWELFQAYVPSPLFLDRIQKKTRFYFNIYKPIQRILKNWWEGKDYKKMESFEEARKEKEEKDRLRVEIAEAWDTIPLGQIVRGIMLLSQSFFRKYIKLPLFIFSKNIVRMLLFQHPEWFEDLQEWNREMYVKCTYNGVPLSETEFPKNWLTDGIQIKIVFPFYIKPWHKYKLRSSEKSLIKKPKDDFCFLTIWGMESEFPFGSAGRRPNFFKPIFKELEKNKKLYKRKLSLFFNLKKLFRSSEIQLIPKKNYDNVSISRSKKYQKGEKIQRKNRQLVDKLYIFFKFYIETMYTKISFSIIFFCKKNIEFFLERTEKIFDKSILNNKRKQEINIKKNDQMSSILPIKKTSQTILYDVSYISQTYVFFKLSQLEIQKTFQFVHQYKEIRPFVKKGCSEIENKGIFIIPLNHKKFRSYEITQWKKWLTEHYQYDLSEIKPPFLIPNTELNRVHIHKKDNSKKPQSNEKDQFKSIPFSKELKILSLYNEKQNFEKNSNYDLLAYKFITSEKQCFFYRSVNKSPNFSFNFKLIPRFFGKLTEIKRTNYNKGFFDWMGMNTERIKVNVVNPELWFFSEFCFLSKRYKKKPWFIPSKLLLLNWNINEKNTIENQKINEKKKFLVSSKKKTPNENQSQKQRDLESVTSQKNDIQEISIRSEEKKRKQYKSKIEAELDLFLKRYFIFQLRGNNAFPQKMISNIKAYCLLLKLMDPKRITLSSIQKRELGLDIMLIHKNLTLKELMNRGIFLIEPVRMSVNKQGQFIMYQTVNISLVHKSKQQTNKKDQEERYLSKYHSAKVFSKHQRKITSINKNFALLIPENILSLRHCRTLRICIYLHSKNKDVERNTFLWNGKDVKNIRQVSLGNNDLDPAKKQLMELKEFVWPNYRLEDLACMNRYWFNTTNGSRLNLLRVQFYS
nr:hypothetical chloroplast RF19 [Utricularia olivacea]